MTEFHFMDFFWISLTYFSLYKLASYMVDRLFINSDKHFMLIRGLPGSGKSSLRRNKLQRENYMVFDMDKYIQRDDYSIKEAQMIIANKLLKAFSRDFRNVCVMGVFSKKIEYDFYINLARRFGYKPIIWEISNEQNSEECFEYSKHTFPEKYNKYLVNSWEKDVDAVIYPSWLDDSGYYNFEDIVEVGEDKEESTEESEVHSEVDESENCDCDEDCDKENCCEVSDPELESDEKLNRCCNFDAESDYENEVVCA